MNFCKDCKYFEEGYATSYCHHPKNGIDLVYGTIHITFARVSRKSLEEGDCGPEGVLFVERVVPLEKPKANWLLPWRNTK